ncbi:hypothetical protein C0993_005646, partial [Termitomyces sp. T159_Od127]
ELLEYKAEDVLDALKQGAVESKLKGVVVPASLISLLLKADNEGGKSLIVAHSEIEEVFLSLRYSVKHFKLTGELLCKCLPIGQYQAVGVELEQRHVIVKGDAL